MQFSKQPQAPVDIPIEIDDSPIPIDPESIPTLTEDDVIVVDNDELETENGWLASFELAKIAKEKGVDLSTLSREEYADFAIEHSLAIHDQQLRVATWYRSMTSDEELTKKAIEKKSLLDPSIVRSFNEFTFNLVERAINGDVLIADSIKIDGKNNHSKSWVHFQINAPVLDDVTQVFKSYISLKDLNKLTPDVFFGFLVALRDAGYQGWVKIFQDIANEGVLLNDQIVMHGESSAQASLALEVAETFFADNVYQASIGKDIKNENNTYTSYSQVLAHKIKDSILKKNK